MTRARILLIAVCVLLLPAAAAAEERYFSVGPWGVLGIELPEGWTAEPQGAEEAGGAALLVRPAREIPLLVMLTPFPVPGNPALLAGSLEQRIDEGLQEVREIALEKEVPTRVLEGPGYRFVYVSVTDSTVEVPTEDDFKYMDQGLGVVGGLLVTFTLLTNVADAPERDQALEALRSARHLAPGSPWRTPEGAVRLWYPGKDWQLVLDLPGYEMPPLELSEQADAVRLEGSNPSSGMRFTLFLEKAEEGWSAADNRKHYWKSIRENLPMRRKDVQRYEKGSAAILEFVVPEIEGVPLDHKSLNLFLVRDGVWIDLHLSKDGFEPEDQALFDAVAGSVRFEDGPPPGE